MKNLLSSFCLLLALCSGSYGDKTSHPSFKEIERFIQAEAKLKEFSIGTISVTNLNFQEYKKYLLNSPQLQTRNITASYKLTLKSKDKNYPATAEVISTDSIHWKMHKMTFSDQADSLGKHYEQTITWEDLEATPRHHVKLKIAD